MLFLYKGSLEVPAWTVLVRGRWYVLSPAEDRPGGPVVFTDPMTASRWVQWQEGKGMNLEDTEIHPAQGNIGDLVNIWRQLFEGIGYQPQHYAACILDPRMAMHPAQDIDAEAIPFDQDLVPDGVFDAPHNSHNS